MPKRKRGNSGVFRRNKKRRYTRKFPKRKYRIKRPPTIYARHRMEQRTVTTLTYCDTLQVRSGAAGAPDYHEFVCNGLYDPDKTGTGHQPMGFDQLMAKYNHYRVLGSHIEIKILPSQFQTNSSTVLALIGLTVTPTTGDAVVDGNELREQQGTKSTVAPRQAQGLKRLTMGWGLKRTFGAKSSDNNLYGTASSNPSEKSYWRITMIGDLGVQTEYVTLFIKIKYLAEFIEPKKQGSS